MRKFFLIAAVALAGSLAGSVAADTSAILSPALAPQHGEPGEAGPIQVHLDCWAMAGIHEGKPYMADMRCKVLPMQIVAPGHETDFDYDQTV